MQLLAQRALFHSLPDFKNPVFGDQRILAALLQRRCFLTGQRMIGMNDGAQLLMLKHGRLKQLRLVGQIVR